METARKGLSQVTIIIKMNNNFCSMFHEHGTENDTNTFSVTFYHPPPLLHHVLPLCFCYRGDDLMTILCRVNNDISQKEGNPWYPGHKKQMSETKNFTLRKKLVFTPISDWFYNTSAVHTAHKAFWLMLNLKLNDVGDRHYYISGLNIEL